MKTDWLAKLIIDTRLIDNSSLSEKEKCLLSSHLTENKSLAEIGAEMKLTEDRVRQMIENGLGKIFFTTRDLIVKASSLEQSLAKKQSIECELWELKKKFEKELAEEGRTQINFDPVNVSIGEMRLSVRARKTLDEMNIKSLKQLAALTKEMLRKKNQAGVKTIAEIIRIAEEYGVVIK